MRTSAEIEKDIEERGERRARVRAETQRKKEKRAEAGAGPQGVCRERTVFVLLYVEPASALVKDVSQGGSSS